MIELRDMFVSTDVYEEDINEATVCDLSNQGLVAVPDFTNKLLTVLYLQNNKIKEIPEDFFPSFPSLMWLDLRDNLLTDIPKTIKNHPNLTHLLLQNNNLKALPSELGTVATLKVLQINENPLTFPPKSVLNAGIEMVKKCLHDKYIDELFEAKVDLSSNTDTDRSEFKHGLGSAGVSYNSVIDKLKSPPINKPMSVQLNEKDPKLDAINSAPKDENGDRKIKKCSRLPMSRAIPLPPYCQSAKYLKNRQKLLKINEVRELYQKQVALKKRKEYLTRIERDLQEKKTLEAMRNWRQTYRYRQCFTKKDHKFDPSTLPYDTNPDCMTILTREEIEKDLPDKYKRKLLRKSKPSVPRKNNSDVHLAMKIKQLFENLEAIDLKKETLTPRSEQKMLLGEIQKITEIKQKLDELSTSNIRSVNVD